MKVLIVCPSIISKNLLYGGIERVLWCLGKELFKLGHTPIYLVKQGSECNFAKIIFLDESIKIVDQIPNDIDFVHFHITPKNLYQLKKPYLITIHGNENTLDSYDLNTVFVSRNHAQQHNSLSYVSNGLDWDDYTKPNLLQKRTAYHFLGKAAWRVKNVKGAIQIIKHTKSEQLNILGGTRFNIKMGLRFTFSPRIKFYGMVGGQQKCQLLNCSKGLIFPVLWHEPFGLAIIESLYFGCPVFGTPYGSLPEIINPKFGFLSNKMAELVSAIECQNYNPKLCHEYALEQFNSKKMTLAYIEKYEQILSQKALNNTPPHLTKIATEKFLEWHL